MLKSPSVGWGLYSTEIPSSLGFDSRHSRNFFRGKIIDVTEVNQWHWLEKSGHGLENVDKIHLVLASGKPVLQKSPATKIFNL